MKISDEKNSTANANENKKDKTPNPKSAFPNDTGNLLVGVGASSSSANVNAAAQNVAALNFADGNLKDENKAAPDADATGDNDNKLLQNKRERRSKAFSAILHESIVTFNGNTWVVVGQIYMGNVKQKGDLDFRILFTLF